MAIKINRREYNPETQSYVEVEKDIAHGAVLKIEYGRSVRIMSDVWGQEDIALIWNFDKAAPEWVTLDVWEYSPNRSYEAAVDATAEVKELYRQWRIRMVYDLEVSDETSRVNRKEKGDRVKVVRGRQNKGTEGVIAVVIERPYGMGWRSSLERKFGIATSDVMVDVAAPNGKVYRNYRDIVWAWARNCDKLDIPQVDVAGCMERAVAKVDAEIAREEEALRNDPRARRAA
jgi:hypothetical protein